ncbi:MAG: hypothetical protein ABI047_03380 [Jatrophihabitantaceae bacterium]
MNAARARRPRTPSAIEFNLDVWLKAVLAVEATFRSDELHYWDLPCCPDPLYEGVRARDRLEAVIRRGGRQGRRAAVTVRVLDDRFERATARKGGSDPWLPWWHQREHVNELL